MDYVEFAQFHGGSYSYDFNTNIYTAMSKKTMGNFVPTVNNPYKYFYKSGNPMYARSQDSTSDRTAIGFSTGIIGSYSINAVWGVDDISRIDYLSSYAVVNIKQISGRYRAKDVFYAVTHTVRPIASYNQTNNYSYGMPCNFLMNGKLCRSICFDGTFVGGGTRTLSIIEGYCYSEDDKSFIDIPRGAEFDFGTGVDIPEFIYNWIIENTSQIYPYEYSIKSYNNSTIFANISEAPPMKKAKFSYAGKYKTLILTGIDDQEYILEWESETIEGKVLGGLSLMSGNGSIIIPSNGEEIDINLGASTTLYESYQIYRPLEDPFTILLYQNSSEPHRVDKTDFLTEVGGYSGIFRDSANIVNPIIRVQANDIPNFNYVKIGILNRYYFVTDYDIVRTGLIDLYLTEDVLMTYREGIYKLQAFIDRNQYANNPYLVDKKRVIEEGINVETHSIENDVMSNPFLQPDTDIRFVMNGYKIASWGIAPI